MLNFAAAKIIKMIQILLISTLIIAIAMVFFLVRVLFVRQGEFKSQHIHDSHPSFSDTQSSSLHALKDVEFR